MEPSLVLAEAFALTHRRFRTVLTDLLWKSLWFILVLVGVLGAVFWIASELGSLEWQGPELTSVQPIMVVTALRQLWTMFSGTVFWMLLSIAGAAGVLWLVLESYFRGGPGDFWIFLAAKAARMTILVAAAFLLGTLVLADDTGGTGMIALVILLSLWFIVTAAETLIRKDAVDLFATDLFLVAAVLGVLLAGELLVGAAVLAVSAALVLHASRPSDFLVMLGLSAAGVVVGTAIHSYLMVVRFSAVEIMRRNVVDV